VDAMNELLVGDQDLTDLTARVSDAAERATAFLFDRQRADGGWTDWLASSALSTSLGVLALSCMDESDHRSRIDGGLEWLRRNQRDDGGWSMAETEPPSSPGMTAFAVGALNALAPDSSRASVARGMAFIESQGYDGIPGMTGPKPKTWPAAAPLAWWMAGMKEIDALPRLPVEVMLLPSKLRNKVSIGLPGVLALAVMQAHLLPATRLRRFFQRLAEPRALEWLRSALGPNGGIEECPMIAALIVIGLSKAGVGEDLQQASLDYLLSTQRDDGSWPVDRDLEIAVTAYAVLALAEFGDVADDPRLAPTRDWLLSTQWTTPFTPLKLPAGGWSWSTPSGWPESEDTAVVLSVLGLLGLRSDHPSVRAGLRWLNSRQNRNGSWSEWVRNSNLLNDKPCVGVTAHVVMALHQYGEPGGRRSRIGRALRYLEREQRFDGAAPSLWFRDSVHGTAKLLEMYAELGRPDTAAGALARGWLLANQRPDGAWPTTVEVSADGPTAEETAWAVYSLLRSGMSPGAPQIVDGIRWLLDHQDPSGTWRPSPVGLYFEDFCYTSDLITHTYALRTLGRWLRVTRPSPPS
jgi:squalene-hopene/tetraprenyl-beta-curcumene cyclase